MKGILGLTIVVATQVLAYASLAAEQARPNVVPAQPLNSHMPALVWQRQWLVLIFPS